MRPRRLLAAAFLTVVLVPAATGHTGHHHAAQGVDPRPGVISASSPLYAVDVAADRALVTAGLRSPGDIAFERASEMSQAVDRNDTQARERAEGRLNQVAEVASSNDTSGLEKAAAVLEAVQARAPSQAQQGVTAALDNVRQAQDRAPSQVPDIAGGDTPSGGNGNPPR